jgi:hypothetical protein
MKIKVPKSNYSIVELYEATAQAMGYTNTDKLEFDCRNINVAKNIQDGIYDKYLELGKEQQISDQDVRVGVTMLPACSGPKVDENLADDEVEVFDGFICSEKGE